MLFNNKLLIGIGSLFIGLTTPSLSSAAFIPFASARTQLGNAISEDSVSTVVHASQQASNGTLVSINDYANFAAVDTHGNAVTVMFGGAASAQASAEGLKVFSSVIVSDPVLLGSNSPYLTGLWPDETVNPDGVPTVFNAQGTARLTDTLTVGADEVSYIKLKLGLSGVVGGSAEDDIARDNVKNASVHLGQYTIGVDGRLGPWASLYQGGISYGFGEPRSISEEIWTNAISVHDRQATYRLDLSAGSSVNMELWSSVGDIHGIEGGLYSVTSDFSHTLNILEIHGFDANGNPINLGSATSSQGTIYNVAALQNNQTSSVPEPESLALVLTGLGIMGIFSRRRRGS